jgi:hypothetical protein
MKKDEVDKLRWGQYNLSIPIDEDLMAECLEIFNVVDRRKGGDVLNWEEKAALNEVTKRSGKFLGQSVEPANPKERDLMKDFGNILNEMEQTDEKR